MIWAWDLLLLAIVLVLDRWVSARRYTPLSIFAVCWLGPLALRHLNLVDYESLTPNTAFMVYGGLLLFALGHAVVMLSARSFWPAHNDAAMCLHCDSRTITIICILVCGTGFLATIVQVQSVIENRGLIGFLLNPLEVRDEFMVTGWDALFLLNILLPALLVLRHRMRGGHLDRLTVIMTVIAISGLVLANQKQALVKAGIVALVVATLFEQHVRLRGLMAVALIFLLFFIAYARVTSPYYRGDHRFYVRDGHIALPQALAPLGNPYHYMTSGYGNFQVFTDDIEHYSDGRQSMRPLRYLWIRLQGSREIEPHHGPFYYAPLFGNTHTYLRQFYADAGVPGVLVLSAILGALCGWIYSEIVYRGRLWLGPMYGVMGWCLFISFFSNHWVYFGTWLLLFFALILGLACGLPIMARRWNESIEHGRTA